MAVYTFERFGIGIIIAILSLALMIYGFLDAFLFSKNQNSVYIGLIFLVTLILSVVYLIKFTIWEN